MNRTRTLQIGRHVTICVVLMLGLGVKVLPLAFWTVDPRLWIVLGGSVLAYVFALQGVRGHARAEPSATPPLRTTLLQFGAWFGLWLLVTVLLESGLAGPALLPINRLSILAALVWGLVGLLLTTRTRPSSLIPTMVIGIALPIVLAAHVAIDVIQDRQPSSPQQTTRTVETSLYQLKLVEYVNSVPVAADWRRGGGLADWGSDYLLATGDGRIYVFNEDAGASKLRIEQLPYQSPLNTTEFQAGAADVYSDTPSQSVDSDRFRVAGVLVQDLGGTRRLLVSHHHWDGANKCFSLRVSALEGSPNQFQTAESALQWRTVYDTRPCLKLNTTDPGSVRFEGNENGGRMAALGDDEILLTVGDHGFDGVTRATILAQDLSTDYGKILRINVKTGTARIFTSGHRNPQGLHITSSGEIWETEHGPRGGDELNRIVEGRNYGWPLVTYGTDYPRRTWPLNPQQGRHDRYELPVYAFLPSVGLSPLTSVTADRFALWKDDLLMGSLKRETLYRAHIRDGRVVFAEIVPLNERLRDLRIGHDGRLLILTDSNKIIFSEPTEVGQGEAVGAQCRACHGLNSWDTSTTLGPNLFGLLNRPVASRTDFDYSKALSGLRGNWTPDRLDAFIANPQKFLPGTKMSFPGVPDPEQRRLLMEYLGNVAENP